jgi:hydrogenase nickel incorporation protein HypA/HybF
MHEVGIASAILEAAHQETASRPGAKLVRVGVRVGVLSGVDIDALRFAFECITSQTGDEKVELAAESCPRMNRCEACAHEFASPDLTPFCDAACPRCHTSRTRFASGDQLDIAFIEVEEP